MDYYGINIPGLGVRNEFVNLMLDAGVKYVDLSELLLHFTAIILNPDMRVMTGHIGQEGWMFWSRRDNQALSLVPPGVRYQYVLDTIRDHQQTQLSS